MADTKISALTASTTPLAGTEVLPIVQSGTTKQVSVANLTAGRAVSMLSGTITDNIATPVPLNINNNNAGTSAGTRVNFQFNGTTSGYVGNQFDGADFSNLYDANRFHIFTVGGTEYFRIVNADVTVKTGNLVIGTSGKGIDFSATPGTGTSELLADYEEGTFTATLYDAASGGNASATTVTGYYTKVGNLVTCAFSGLNGINTAGMTAGNTLYVGALPFTASATGIGAGSFACENFAFGAGRTNAIPVVLNSNARAILRAYGSGTSTRSIIVSDVTSGSANIDYFAVSYRA